MTEQDAVAMATAYLTNEGIPFEKLERVFFVPASAYQAAIPDANGRWVVHFDDPVPSTEPDAEVLSCSGPLIVSIDSVTGEAGIVSLM